MKRLLRTAAAPLLWSAALGCAGRDASGLIVASGHVEATQVRVSTKVAGRLEAKIGPIAASFAGTATIQRYDGEYRQVVEGRGGDKRSGSLASGSVDYRLSAVTDATGRDATRVDVVISYALAGPLAQVGRSGLVRDLAHADMCAGGLDRGRAGRIKRKLKKMGRKISERQVLRILDTFSTVSDSAEHTQGYSDHQIHQGETLCTKPTS